MAVVSQVFRMAALLEKQETYSKLRKENWDKSSKADFTVLNGSYLRDPIAFTLLPIKERFQRAWGIPASIKRKLQIKRTVHNFAGID